MLIQNSMDHKKQNIYIFIYLINVDEKILMIFTQNYIITGMYFER